jgi:hypothetical protein
MLHGMKIHGLIKVSEFRIKGNLWEKLSFEEMAAWVKRVW